MNENLPATINPNDAYDIPASETTGRAVLKINHKNGTFETDGLDVGDKVTLILLKASWTRSMMNDDLENPVVLCKSLDFVEGKGNPGGFCVECPNEKFKDKKKPKCQKCVELYFAVWNASTARFDEYIQYARSTAYTPARSLVNTLYKAGTVPYAFYIELSLKQMTYGNSTYCVPVYKIGKELAEKSVQRIFNEVVIPLESEVDARVASWKSEGDVDFESDNAELEEDYGFPNGEFEDGF